MTPSEDYCRTHQLTAPAGFSLYRRAGKRTLDLLVVLPFFLLLLPLLAIAALLVKLDSPGPVFFVQKRLGRYGSTFLTYKFRSMTDRPRTTHTEVLPGHSEVTRTGVWLRRFKIDELPQLWNIVRGDMSLVGPRPALPEHISEYNRDGLERLLERPGLTGLAQVNGNIYLSWPERWAWDARYVRELSLRTDLRIIVRTVAVVVCGEEKFLNRPIVEMPLTEQPAPRVEETTEGRPPVAKAA